MKLGIIALFILFASSKSFGQTIQPKLEPKTSTNKETEKKIITAKPISESNSINKPSSKDKVRVKKLPVRKEVEISEPLKHD